MANAAEHFDSGMYACIPYFFLALSFYLSGFLINSGFELVEFTVFGVIALTVGSELPDIDLKNSHIHRMFLILFPPLIALRKLMPGHRKFIHTIKCGAMFGLMLASICLLAGVEIKLSFWLGVFLFLGIIVHLMKDKKLKN